MINKLLGLALLFSSLTMAAERPKWVDDLTKGCEKKDLCAVGTGATREAASQDAVVGISKIFDTQISSNFSSQSTGTVEEVKEEIKEITQSVLEGVEVKKFYDEKGEFFALANLNKQKAAKSIKKEIDQIDDKIKVLSEEKNSSSKVQLEKIFLKRETLDKRHNFLVGRSVPAKITYEQVFKSKNDSVKNIVVHVYLDEDEPKRVEQALAKEISGLGYKITRGRERNSEATHIVTGEVTADKQYLNVEGFEKYAFHFKASAMKSNKVGTGEMDISIEESGRNFSQAYDKAIPKIIEEIQEKISDLKID